MEIVMSVRFKKSLKKYIQYEDSVKKRLLLFKANPFDRALKTHKLTGELEGHYSFSVNYSLRILFYFLNDKEALFEDIGTHSIYT
jgi:mRNA-degrading endonuclease YafQ of YafQ-DinJ toxin-antitoxin module